MSFIKNYAFTILLLCGIVIGGLCGIIFREGTAIVKSVGDIFLNLIFVLIVPLVFTSVASSIYNMRDSNRIGKVIGSIVFVFLFTGIVAASVSYFFTLLYNPLGGIDRTDLLLELPEQSVKHLTSGEIIVNLFTVSDFQQLFTKSSLLPLVIFSIFFGLATALSGDKGKTIANLLNASNHVIMKLMDIIMKAAPIGLGCYFADTVGKLGGQILSGYMHIFILFLILAGISFFGLNSIYVFWAGGKKGFVEFWKNILTPSLTAIATSSSAACISVNIEASKQMGVPSGIAETVIPLGTNMHKDGSIISAVLKITFLFSIFGQEMTSSSNMFMIIGAAVLVAAVVGAIPSGGMTGELLICSIFGFSPEFAATLMIISTIIDVPATLLNSTGNIVCAMMVSRSAEGKKN
jgi:Na+/H+-dicarboxylate symporter